MEKKRVRGIVRCLNVLESRCGSGMCMFTLAGERNHEILVLPETYAVNAEIIKRGVMLEAEVECFGDSPSARMIARHLFSAGEESVLPEGYESRMNGAKIRSIPD